MNDLLVCLGQEEAKCTLMQQKLEELGVDVIALLESAIIDDGDDV